VYKAVVTLAAKNGYTFNGVAAGSFSYSGATAITNAANSGVVTITFPATGASGQDMVVSAFSLDGLVTAPVRDAQPDTRTINTTQYTGTITWQTAGGAAHNGAFAASTVYKAVVILAAKNGYTFNGVAAGSFSYSGATAITNAANSGVVTITFQPTGAPGTDPNSNTPIFIGSPSVKLYRDGGTTPLEQNGKTTISRGAGIITVSIDSGSYSEIKWYLNDDAISQAQGKTSIVLSKQTSGTYLVIVEATPQGGVKQSGAHTFVIQ
jgi:hypothetical protein